MRRPTGLSRALLAVLAVTAAVTLVGPSSPIASAVSSSGERPGTVTIAPFRLVDTRPTDGGPIGGPATPFGPGTIRSYSPSSGHAVIPADATGVLVNVTAVNATAETFLTLWPDGTARPATSTLNPSPGRIVFNAAVVDLNGGSFDVYNLTGTVDVIIDVTGYLVDHNHDDRYALLHTAHQIAFPIGSLSFSAASAVITVGIDGLSWTNNGSDGASLNIVRPPDWNGSSDVTVRIWYRRMGDTPAPTVVQWYVRPRDFDAGGTWVDEAGLSGFSAATAASVFQSVDVALPAATLQRPLWNLVVQRATTSPTAYPNSVLVYAIEVLYQS